MEELKRRLREESLVLQQAAWSRPDGGQDCSISATLADEALAAIERLEVEIVKLREVLGPFAEIADGEASAQFTNDTVWVLTNGERRLGGLYMRHFRKARAALTPDSQEG